MSKKIKIEGKKRKEKWNLFGSDNTLLDTAVLKGAHIELFSDSRITVEGCDGIYEYNENYLKLRLKKGALVLCGTDFDIAAFEGKNITVNGKIDSLEFCE